ncbi:VOC family protein [Terricaulis sp.]|uniref:VOC family protein n=1 Tax=Terricaulis sp. TaxID=2768686 RepID=UPI0037839B8A
MISGFDHVVIAVRDLEFGIAAYAALLGRPVGKRFVSDGVATALFDLNNIAVELIAPVDDGPAAARLRAALADGEGLKSLVFAVKDADAMHRRCMRIGLEPQAISGPASGDAGQYRVFRISAERTHGVRVFMLQREDAGRERAPALSSVSGLDHVVVQSADMERAAALYGARLGLDMRLDREVAGRRLMFFRCGDAVVEIAHVASLGTKDKLWGLSWRVQDADAARARLAGLGVNVSEVRAGMKPGTRVFTVRDGTCGVPTLMLESAKRD